MLLILTVDVISDEIGQDSTAKLILSTYVMRIFKQANAIQAGHWINEMSGEFRSTVNPWIQVEYVIEVVQKLL